MNHTCKCGGRMRSIDPVVPAGKSAQGHTLYATVRLEEGKATFRCEKCGKRAQQGLRKPKA